MTREEAIKKLRKLRETIDRNNAYDEAEEMGIQALERESCEDAISRKSIKQKLQEHHDFFINTYSGFSNLPQNDKSRVDEITNCIAMVVNEPTVTPQPKIGYWIEKDDNLYVCSECGQYIYSETEHDLLEFHAFCGRCGTKMIEPQESEVQDA